VSNRDCATRPREDSRRAYHRQPCRLTITPDISNSPGGFPRVYQSGRHAGVRKRVSVTKGPGSLTQPTDPSASRGRDHPLDVDLAHAVGAGRAKESVRLQKPQCVFYEQCVN
jgi:hypothetical protein